MKGSSTNLSAIHLSNNECSLYDLFEKQAFKTPIKTAVVFQNEIITYSELNRKVTLLASYISSIATTGPNIIIGLLVEPSIEMIVAILAILKTRSAYLPLDIDIPAERMARMFQEAGASILFTQTRFRNSDFLAPDCTIYLDNFDFSAKIKIKKQFQRKSSIDDLACILFTSGSTGKPKGVMIKQKSIIRLAKDNNFLEVTEKDIVLNVLNYAFDATLYNFFSALLNGVTLHLVTKDFTLNLKRLSQYIRKQEITILNLTTAFFNLIVDQHISCFSKLRKVLFGGENVSINHVRRFFDTYGAGKLIHVYGPTENTTFSTFYEVNEIPSDALTIPIGKPVKGSSCLALNEFSQVIKEGQFGELHVGGIGLAMGYTGDADLWNSKLLPDPFKEGDFLYRTGDIVRLIPGGYYEFARRKDNQVKIRGFRVEPNEVEQALMGYGGVMQAKVCAVINEEDCRLICFLIPTVSFEYKSLLATIKSILPEYMIPSIFYQVTDFPFTENGKIDIKALVKNKESYSIISSTKRKYQENTLQSRLIKLWEKVLDRKDLGIEDNFFESGGNSIKAIQLVSELEKQIAVRGGLEQLYKYPTVKKFSEHLKKNSNRVNVKYCIPINHFEIGNNNFFVAPSSWGEENDMNIIASNLNGKANFFKLQISGLFEDKLEKSILKLAEGIVKKILRVPKGEQDFIIGYSWGCFLAFEIVKQLEVKGRNVCLFLFDCDPKFKIKREEIKIDRYDFFTLDTIHQYLPNVKTLQELNRLKKFWMNNNIIHADYLINDSIQSDIYTFEALDYIGSSEHKNEEKDFMLGTRADMNLWKLYTSGNFMNYKIPGNHGSIIKINDAYITEIFENRNMGSIKQPYK